MIKKIYAKKLLTLLLSCILCVAMTIAIVPKGVKAQTLATENLVQKEMTNEYWEIVNKTEGDLSAFEGETYNFSSLEFTKEELFGGQIISKEKLTGSTTIEFTLGLGSSSNFNPNLAYTYVAIGKDSVDRISTNNLTDGGIILGFHAKGVAIFDSTYEMDKSEEQWRCSTGLPDEYAMWRPIYTASAWRASDSVSYKIVITETNLTIYGEWNKTADPAGSLAISNSGYTLTDGHVAIANRHSKYVMSTFKVNDEYTAPSDWITDDGVTLNTSLISPNMAVLKDVDNVKSSSSALTDNPLLVSKFTVSTEGVEEGAEVFSLDLDFETIRPRNDYFRFLFGLSENNDNPTKIVNFTSLGADSQATCVYIFDSAYTSGYVDGLGIIRFSLSIKGYQNGDVVFSYDCPDPNCPGHTVTISGVDLNGKIGIQTITDSDAPQSQCIKVSKNVELNSLFSGNVVAQPVTITLTNGETSKQEVVNTITYKLPNSFTTGKTLIGWLDSNGELQRPGKVYTDLTDMTFTAVETNLAFALANGASIRIDTVGDTSGIRFTAVYNTEAMESISEYVLEKGMLLVKTSAFAAESDDAQKSQLFVYKDTLAHTFEGAGVIDGDYTKHAYAIYEIGETDFETEISARGYIKVNYADGEGYIYTEFTIANNSRSIKTVAQGTIGTDFYNSLDADQQSVINKYAGQ